MKINLSASPPRAGLALAAAVTAALLAAPAAGAQTAAPADHPAAAREMRIVRGTVRSGDGAAAPGVVVALKGTSLRALTAADGRYALRLPAGPEGARADTLEFTRTGHAPRELPVTWTGAEATVDVVLDAGAAGTAAFHADVDRLSLPLRAGPATRSGA